jgi:hypothetical protein
MKLYDKATLLKQSFWFQGIFELKKSGENFMEQVLS